LGREGGKEEKAERESSDRNSKERRRRVFIFVKPLLALSCFSFLSRASEM
jgi:hypothetical protein